MENEVKVKSLYRALKLLDCFDEQHTELGPSELSRMSGNLKSTTYNIMDTFASCGFVEHNPENGKYRLGHRIMELSSVMYLSNDFRQIIRPFIGRIANYCKETVYLAVPQDTDALYLDAAYPNGSIHLSSVIGKRVPMYCTAVGKAMLACLPRERFDCVVREGMPALTQHTITS
ncbi:MAG: IclR family transcriptional regulator, partial [Clostridia bacterium]|nr:IclR family transcriptional regulator [Clostridia bacterium]